MPLIASLSVAGLVLAQSSFTNDWNVTNVAILIWVAGQVAVMIINAIKGNPQLQAQSEQIQKLFDAHNTNQSLITNLAQNQLPPEITAQLVAIIGGRQPTPVRQLPPPADRPATAPDPRIKSS